MANSSFDAPVRGISGKLTTKSSGYFYHRNGKCFYRVREENYQQHQSPKQLWRSRAFAYAQSQMGGKLTPEQVAALEAEWHAAKHLTPFGKEASTPRGWKRSVLIFQWEQEHPFEQWYADYLAAVSAQAEQRTSAAEVSQYQIKKQIAALSAQLDALRSQLK